MGKLAEYIDHTLLKCDASESEINTLCDEATKYGFKSVCINPSYINQAKKRLENSYVLVCTVVGFPLGQMTTTSKVSETIDAIENGADEIDMVINIAKLKKADMDYCINEINAIKKACGNKILKVIVETCLLNEEQKIMAAEIVLNSNADYIKTSTGFSKSGADINDIILWKKILKNKKKIKAAGGIRNQQDLLNFIDAGANRIGTSSGVKLLNKETSNSTY